MAGKGRRTQGRDVTNARRASGIRSPKKTSGRGRGTGNVPSLKNVYAAVEGGYITSEDARELNPVYDPKKIYGSKRTSHTQRNQYRQFSNAAAGFTPNTSDVTIAHRNNKITEEEARDLNPKWDPSKHQINYRRSYLKPGDKANKPRPPEGYKPQASKVSEALAQGHITKEEADELNPKHTADYNRTRASSRISKKEGKTPSLQDVFKAHESGHISSEEATSLNKSYKPENKKQQIQLRRFNKNKDIKASGTGRTPSLLDVHAATNRGHISHEEAVDLNPKYGNLTPRQFKSLKGNLNKRESGWQKNYTSRKWQEEKASRNTEEN